MVRALVRLLVVGSMAAGVVISGGGSALACSCALGDPVTRLAEVDAAFVGALIDVEEPEPHAEEPHAEGVVSSADRVPWTFELEETVKGDLESPLIVMSPWSGVSCGFELALGSRVGVFLYRDPGGGWQGGLCGQIDPDVLLRAAAPLPDPVSQALPVVVVGLTWGERGVVSYDPSGELVAVGTGPGSFHLAGCPDEETFVGWESGEEPQVVVRRYVDLSVVDTMRVETDAYPRSLFCVGPAGSDVLIHFVDNQDGAAFSGEVVHLSGGGLESTGVGSVATVVAAPEGLLVITNDGRLLRLDTQGSLVGTIGDSGADFTDSIRSAQLSPDETWLALAIERWASTPPRFSIGLFDLETGSYRKADRPCSGEIAWLDADRIAAPEDCTAIRTLIFDTELTVIDELSGFILGHSDVVTGEDGTRYWVGFGAQGSIQALPPAAVTPVVVAHLDTPQVYSVLPIPPAAVTTASEQLPPPTSPATTVSTSTTTQVLALDIPDTTGDKPNNVLWPLVGGALAIAAVSALVWRRRSRNCS